MSALGYSTLDLSLRCAGSSVQWAASVVVARGLSFSAACGILVPRPGIEPGSPSLEGGFLTTGKLQLSFPEELPASAVGPHSDSIQEENA